MNLKRRLIITNAAAVIIPVVITALFAFVFISVFSKIGGAKVSFDSYQKLNQIKMDLMSSEKTIFAQTPEKIEEPAFQSYLTERLAGIGGELVITKDSELIYSSSENISKIDIAKLLEYKPGNGISGQTIPIGSVHYSVERIEVPYKNSIQGMVFLLAPINALFSSATFLIALGVCFILLTALTIFFLSYHLSRQILKPVGNLQKAAAEISNGVLTAEIVEEGDEEIQALCRDMELMRIKLKELIHDRLKYEENRKALVSSISHDLKTPVTSIKGYVEGILDGVANTPEKRERYLQTIYLKTQQVDKMIDDLLLYAKLDLNQIPFNFERTDIGTYLYECLVENEPELERYNIKVSFRDELKRPQNVLLDQARMKRVIMNIVDNSRKYMNKEEGEIQFIIRETQSSVILELRDNGEGIDEKDLPHIFDRFYRSDEARSEIKGSGLGLAIAKQIVEGHQGKIWVVSRKGDGISVMISLKRRREFNEENPDY